MDLILFCVGFIFLIKRDYGFVIGIVVLLASGYLGVSLQGGSVSQYPFLHNIQDTGIVLYLIMFLSVLYHNGGVICKDEMAKSVIVFFMFLFLSGSIDVIYSGYNGIDVLKNIRNWLLLSVVFIIKVFDEKSVRRMISVVLYATIILCLLLLIQRLFGVHIIGENRYYYFNGISVDRGVKPPFYVILCIFLVYSRYYKIGRLMKWTFIGIMVSDIVMSMKVSYFIAVIIGVIMIELLPGRRGLARINKLYISVLGFGLFVAFIYLFNPIFVQRIFEDYSQLGDIKSRVVTGNFDYRIQHFIERYEYCVDSGARTTLFGIGSISEEHYDKSVFALGTIDVETDMVKQIDTGDIAWSLMILRFGFIGIISFMYMYISLVYKLFSYMYLPVVMVIFVYMLINLLYMSLSATNIMYGEFYVLPLIVRGVTERRKT